MARMSKGGYGPGAKLGGKGKGPKMSNPKAPAPPARPRTPTTPSVPNVSTPFTPPTASRGSSGVTAPAPSRPAVPTPARQMTTMPPAVAPVAPGNKMVPRPRPGPGINAGPNKSSDRHRPNNFSYLPWNR